MIFAQVSKVSSVYVMYKICFTICWVCYIVTQSEGYLAHIYSPGGCLHPSALICAFREGLFTSLATVIGAGGGHVSKDSPIRVFQAGPKEDVFLSSCEGVRMCVRNPISHSLVVWEIIMQKWQARLQEPNCTEVFSSCCSWDQLPGLTL